MRAEGWTYREICAELGVSRASVSLWARDVPFDEAVWASRARANRNHGARRARPNRLALARMAEVEALREEGRRRNGRLSEKEFLVAGTALYAGEGAKGDGSVTFPNNDPRMILFFVSWLRRFFVIDEARLRLRLYLHQGLDIEAANRFWSELTDIPSEQFGQPYRAPADPTIRKAKRVMGCPAVRYSSTAVHRAVMGLVDGLLSSSAYSGVAQSAAQLPVKETVVGSSPTPGAHSPELIDPPATVRRGL